MMTEAQIRELLNWVITGKEAARQEYHLEEFQHRSAQEIILRKVLETEPDDVLFPESQTSRIPADVL